MKSLAVWKSRLRWIRRQRYRNGNKAAVWKNWETMDSDGAQEDEWAWWMKGAYDNGGFRHNKELSNQLRKAKAKLEALGIVTENLIIE